MTHVVVKSARESELEQELLNARVEVRRARAAAGRFLPKGQQKKLRRVRAIRGWIGFIGLWACVLCLCAAVDGGAPLWADMMLASGAVLFDRVGGWL